MAHKINNVTLPPERVFPFQLVAESKWGYKWIKWITYLQLIVDQQSVLHILGIQSSTAGEKRGSNDHCIVHAQTVPFSDESPQVMGFD